MLKVIRNLNFGWIIVLTGLIIIVSGISMTDGTGGEKSFLCFDQGCLYVQGFSNIAIGFICVVTGIYLIIRK